MLRETGASRRRYLFRSFLTLWRSTFASAVVQCRARHQSTKTDDIRNTLATGSQISSWAARRGGQTRKVIDMEAGDARGVCTRGRTWRTRRAEKERHSGKDVDFLKVWSCPTSCDYFPSFLRVESTKWPYPGMFLLISRLTCHRQCGGITFGP